MMAKGAGEIEREREAGWTRWREVAGAWESGKLQVGRMTGPARVSGLGFG